MLILRSGGGEGKAGDPRSGGETGSGKAAGAAGEREVMLGSRSRGKKDRGPMHLRLWRCQARTRAAGVRIAGRSWPVRAATAGTVTSWIGLAAVAILAVGTSGAQSSPAGPASGASAATAEGAGGDPEALTTGAAGPSPDATAISPSSSDPEAVRSLAARILGDGYQRALPDGRAATDRYMRARILLPGFLSRPVAFLMRVLFYLVITVGGLLVCYWSANAVWGRLRGRSKAALAVGSEADSALLRGDLAPGDAVALAGQRRFAEAIHILLLRSLRELDESLPSPLPDSLTSREILTRLSLSRTAREALRTLVLCVETSRFGGRAPGQDDYERCVACAEVLHSAQRGSAS